ncbi:MAG: aminotransferase class IV [Bacteroidota bacterium]|jgi:branched-chain amino acid aminotransferase
MSRIIEFFNGNRIHPGSSFLNGSNRSFLFGDGVFETIRVLNGKALFLSDHLERLVFGMDRLMMEPPMEQFEEFIRKSIPSVLEKEKVTNGRIRVSVYREASGFYTPEDLNTSWHLMIREADSNETVLECSATIFSNIHKSNSMISRVKTTSSLIYVMAGIHAATTGFDESIILNPDGRIVESHTSNIFIRKGKNYHTPPLSEGCIDGVMRRQIIGVMNRSGFDLQELPLTKADLMGADEILLTNVMQWVRNVTSFSNKSYESNSGPVLNRMILESISQIP